MKKINKFKFISFLLAFIFIFTLTPMTTTFADNEVNSTSVNSVAEVKPQIDIKYLGTNPVEPIEGMDFDVKYEITAHPFQHNITLPKEIILVLDKSGSMKDNNKMTNLKKAAKEFINSLTKTIEGTGVPEITNLSIGIVAYDSNGYINSQLLEVTDSEKINETNKTKLVKTIDGLSASGGTNIGDGLRKGTYLLDKSQVNANKAIIFMADGEPTYYTGSSSSKEKNYYTILDDIDVNKTGKPYLKGTGNSDRNGYCLEYATTIGSIIRNKSYNVYSIGYGLGNENTNANKKMKQIHESMGGVSSGENSTFFATDSGAIDIIFDQISDNLKKTYDNLDVKLDFKLGSNIVAGEGFEISDGNGNIVKVPEIVYNLGEKNWYTATPERRQIVFKVKANSSGDSVSLFEPGSKLTYKDVNGNIVNVEIPQQTIKIKPYIPDEAEKLQVNFAAEFTGYLVGDTVKANVSFTHPGSLANNISYTGAKFNIESLPDGLSFAQNSSNELNFGTIRNNITKEYYFKINNNQNYKIEGNFQYDMKKGSSSSVTQAGTLSDTINVKQGKVRVKVLDESGADITEYSTISIKNYVLQEYNGIYNTEDKFINFNEQISTGNYELTIKSLPEGCIPKDDQDIGKVMVNYDNNIVEYIFTVNGVAQTKNLEIDADLLGHTPSYPYLDDDITITYEINPKDFVRDDIGEILIPNTKLIFDLGSKFSPVEGQGLVLDEDGKYYLDLDEKVKYTYDKNNNKYVTKKFTVSFKVRANIAVENISFNEGHIEYLNILNENSEVIKNTIDVPNMTIRTVEGIPEYVGPDIRILEIEPADSFKLTNSQNETIKTGTESNITVNEQGTEYNVEIVHMTMPEFISKVKFLNGKYDVVVIGRYVDNKLKLPNETNSISKEKTYWYRDYINLENDITNKKAGEIKEFIDSGQLVFLDSKLDSVNNSKLKVHYQSTSGDWQQTELNAKNLIKNMSVKATDNNKLDLQAVVKKYDELIKSNSNIKRAKLTSSTPIGDTIQDDLGKIYKRNMRFDIKSEDLSDNEEVTINLYLDINGDGLFKSEEIVNQINSVKIPKSGYTFNYNMYNDYPLFIGYLDWRIEVVRSKLGGYSEPMLSYVDGSILFRRITKEKRVIDVLQVSPFEPNDLNSGQNSSAANNGGNLNIKTNKNFQQLLKLDEVKDYDIQIDVISYKDFYQNDYLGPGKESLNGSKYDIVIVGFADCFKDKRLSKLARDELKKFIKSGQGLMLTHDTLWYKGEDITKSYEMIKEFRDIIGQSRYVDHNNPTEEDLNGEKIIHDPNRPSGNSGQAVGSTLWSRNSVNDSNSTEVYRVNESLLTNYPFELGENIRIRRTHAQYLQLNLEDESVVPSFSLTSNNFNNNGTTTSNGSYKNNYVNQYDSRNSYYTYSKGNITFSGTGENTRENIEYPDSELRLFVNTIVKAERGANHKPEISGLENITEIPYNSDLSFNAIIKDVDGDKVRINKIMIDNNVIDGYNSPTDFKIQGSAFPVIISKGKFESKIDKEVNITIEAEDSKGAVTIKEYAIIPVRNPLLTSKGDTFNTLVGEKIDFRIKLDKENDTIPTRIFVDSIEVSEKIEIVELKDIETKSVNGDLYLVGSLKVLVEVTGEQIPIIINYNNGTSTIKKCEVKIILNSKHGNVNICIKSSDGNEQNLGLNPKITLLNKTNNKVYEGNISVASGLLNFNSIEAGQYCMTISELTGYNIASIYINDENQIIDESQSINFDLNFTNSSKNIEIIVTPQVSDLTHGLYQGINTNGKLTINENQSGFEIAAGMNVNFGSTFILGGSSPQIKLNIDSKLVKTNNKEEINKNNIRVYKVIESNGKEVLNEFELSNLEINRVNSEYIIRILESIESNTKILITYSAKVPNGSKKESFNNIIDISGKTKLVNVYNRDTGDKPAYLPDLF